MRSIGSARNYEMCSWPFPAESWLVVVRRALLSCVEPARQHRRWPWFGESRGARRSSSGTSPESRIDEAFRPDHRQDPKVPEYYGFQIILNAPSSWSEIGPASTSSFLFQVFFGGHFVSAVAGPSDWNHE